MKQNVLLISGRGSAGVQLRQVAKQQQQQEESKKRADNPGVFEEVTHASCLIGGPWWRMTAVSLTQRSRRDLV